MIKRENTKFSIASIRDLFKLGNFDLDPPYQRRSVWSVSFKQYFVDSILRNFPVPPMFVTEDVMPDGRVIYRVVDGKQRLTSVLEFLDDIFTLGDKSDPALQKKYYSQLESDVKKHFLSYRLNFESLNLDDGDTITIEEIYDRFNRNVARLNDQELRKAKYKGSFAQKMEEIADQLADDTFWIGLRLFSKTAVRRMKDVEYISELCVLTMDGVQEPDVLDDYYANNDDELPENWDRTYKLFNKIKQEIESLNLDFEKTRYGNLNDFYSLWAAVHSILLDKRKIDYIKTNKKLTAFSKEIEAAVPNYKGDIEPSEAAKKYSDAVRQGVNKKTNRDLRAEFLRNRFVLEEK